MDIILSAIGDIAKHIIQGMINTQDKALDIKVISLVSVLISFIVKCLTLALKIDIAYCRWYIYYHIFQNKSFKFPLFGDDAQIIIKNYYEVNLNKSYTSCIYDRHNVNKFYLLFGHKLASYRWGKRSINSQIVSLHDDVDENNKSFDNIIVNANYIYKICMTSPQFADINKQNNTVINGLYLAYINGYYIYINNLEITLPENNQQLTLACQSKEALQIFTDYLREEAKNMPVNKVECNNYIYDATTNVVNNTTELKMINIGNVKPNLTMDNYVSRNKPNLIKHLNAFRDNKLFSTNPYLENNLGILLYGGYGTGKSYMISAIANYLGRSICNINFAKIKTISAFRLIMNKENCKKYVFCFDEFDYLLTDILDSNQATDKKADLQFKIHTLTQQLAAVKDNRGLTDSILKEIKDLMSTGTSDTLTYPALLSELSGISSVTDRIIIATTNFIDRIPPALLRPGRFDLVMELSYFNSDEIRELLCKLYKPTTEALAKLNRVTFQEDRFTPAELILQSCKHPKLSEMVKHLGGKLNGPKYTASQITCGVMREEDDDMCNTC